MQGDGQREGVHEGQEEGESSHNKVYTGCPRNVLNGPFKWHKKLNCV